MNASILRRIELRQGDITKLNVDAVVNAANTSLLGGGGVDGAIHRAAGPGLLEECRALGGCSTGSAKITSGHKLPARRVIHAVGPVFRDGQSGEPERLAGCYRTSLQLAVDHGCRTIAFPAISCGVYGYPFDEAAPLALREVGAFLSNDNTIEKVIFVLFDQRAYQAFENALRDLEKELGE